MPSFSNSHQELNVILKQTSIIINPYFKLFVIFF